MPNIQWKTGTAFDFFVSLVVLHQPGTFAVRPSWAAGVRQRLPVAKREFLEKIHSISGVPLVWLSQLPDPGDAFTALRSIDLLSPLDRLVELTLTPDIKPNVRDCLLKIAKRGSVLEGELILLRNNYHLRDAPLPPKGLLNLVEIWSNFQITGELYYSALQDYYQSFFAEEEIRIRPALQAGLERGQELASQFSLDSLIEELSHGVRFTPMDDQTEITLAPSYWSSPFIFYTRQKPDQWIMLFGARPGVETIVPGAGPSSKLVSALKALSDPTRLRILRFLSDQPRSSSELARQLRLRLPTVIHHLRILRLAGLVHITVEETEKRYASRLEVLESIQSTLVKFIRSEE